MLYVTNNPAVNQAHWGGSAFALSHLGIHSTLSLYTGFIAVVINLLVTALVTLAAKALRVPDGVDQTAAADYFTDEADLPAPASEAVPA
jgi:SSS family solute:Na+ symporter